MAFDLDFKEEGKIQIHIKKFFLLPEYWEKPGNQFPTHLVWNSKKFSKQNKNIIPLKKGIYAFVLIPKYDNFIETKYLFYVGKTNRTLRKRFSEYFSEKEGKGKPRKKVFKMLNQYDGYLYFYYSEITNTSDVDECEERLLNTFVPHVNTSIPEAKIKPELKYIYEGN
jgi:excinuclease UvrABC nuclease subunit